MKLVKTLNYSLSKYGEDAVLCTAQANGSKEATVFLIPTLEDLCFGVVDRVVETADLTFHVRNINQLIYMSKSFGRVIVNPKYEEEYKCYFANADDTHQIKTGILNLVRNRAIATDNYEVFSQSLTPTEMDALDEIKDKIGSEGIISINSLSKETGISRPIFLNLLNKMTNTKVAETSNMGGKGTYIKIINDKLL